MVSFIKRWTVKVIRIWLVKVYKLYFEVLDKFIFILNSTSKMDCQKLFILIFIRPILEECLTDFKISY